MPHAVVVPFGVPEEGEGLGIGLAALVHGFVRLRGESIGLAQLMSKDATKTVETYVPPAAWKELAQNGLDTGLVDLVVTGSFEPPETGRGSLTLIAFDPKTGDVKAKEETGFGASDSGSALAKSFHAFCKQFDADFGDAKFIDELEWASLESVLRAERCNVPNPLKQGARDRYAVLSHLERAVADAPLARFPGARLAACAMEAAFTAPSFKLRDAAMRSVVRAIADSPSNVELLEAASAMELRFVDSISAEARILNALTLAPDRGSLYALLCESRRSRRDHEGARDAVSQGISRGIKDPLLFTERGVLLLEAGDAVNAAAHFRDVLQRWPFFPSAFKNLAQMALREGDSLTAQSLVDAALAAKGRVHPDVLRHAIELALRTEPLGIARASRVAELSRSLVAMAPQDPWARLVSSRALVETGDAKAALSALAMVESLAEGTVMAAEAQRTRFQIQESSGALEVEALLRAVVESPLSALEELVARGRKFTAQYDVWLAPFAVGVAERRLSHWEKSRLALEDAIARAEGCAPAYVELSGVHVALKNFDAAITCAERAVALEGESARTLAVLATALLAGNRKDAAGAAIDRAIALDPNNALHRALADRIRSTPPPPKTSSFLAWLRKK